MNLSNLKIKIKSHIDNLIFFALSEMLKRTLSGVFLFLISVFLMNYNHAIAGSETFLPSREIMLSGTVTAPSCQVKLQQEGRLIFDLNKSANDAEGQAQTLLLELSECDADGIGIMFNATHSEDSAQKGRMRAKDGGQYSNQWYYMISPLDTQDDVWPLISAQDSPDSPEPSRMIGKKTSNEPTYFSLNKVNYWYDIKTPIKSGDVTLIPFRVTMLHDNTKPHDEVAGDLYANFTLQISWR